MNVQGRLSGVKGLFLNLKKHFVVLSNIKNQVLKESKFVIKYGVPGILEFP